MLSKLIKDSELLWHKRKLNTFSELLHYQRNLQRFSELLVESNLK